MVRANAVLPRGGAGARHIDIAIAGYRTYAQLLGEFGFRSTADARPNARRPAGPAGVLYFCGYARDVSTET